MTTTSLSFTTPAKKRDRQAVPVDFCGEHLVVERPKDATLYFAQQVVGEVVADADRAMAVLQFVEGAFGVADRKRFFDRIIDFEDPVDLPASLALLNGLIERWNDWPENQPGHQPEPLVVESSYTPPTGRNIHVRQEAVDLEFTAHPPKDIVTLFVAASMATGANLGQQAWSVSLFLDAALDPADAWLVSCRMRDTDDALDLGHVAEIVSGLIDHWKPGTNREQRRALGR